MTELTDKPQQVALSICANIKTADSQNMSLHLTNSSGPTRSRQDMGPKLVQRGTISCRNCNQFLDPISCSNLVDPQMFVKWFDVGIRSDGLFGVLAELNK